jgi:hypothetical protein
VHEGAPAASSGIDAQLPEPLPETGCTEVSPGEEAGDQPRAVGRGADADVAPAGGDELADQSTERLGDDHLLQPEAQMDLGVSMDHLVNGDHDDAAELLGVQQHEAASHPVGEIDGVVVQETLDDAPALLVVQGAARECRKCRHLEADDEPAVGCPPEKVPHVIA